MLDPDGSGLLIAAAGHSRRMHEEGNRYSIKFCVLRDAAVSSLHLGLSALTSFVLMNIYTWDRLYQQFQSLWGFKLSKTADMNRAKLSLAIC